jgi:hypothetical protein
MHTKPSYGDAMPTNAVFRESTTGPNSHNANAAKTNTEEMLSARRRLEDSFRQAFAERARQGHGVQQCGRRVPTMSTKWRKQ